MLVMFYTWLTMTNVRCVKRMPFWQASFSIYACHFGSQAHYCIIGRSCYRHKSIVSNDLHLFYFICHFMIFGTRFAML